MQFVDEIVATYLNKRGNINAQWVRRFKKLPLRIRIAVARRIHKLGLKSSIYVTRYLYYSETYKAHPRTKIKRTRTHKEEYCWDNFQSWCESELPEDWKIFWKCWQAAIDAKRGMPFKHKRYRMNECEECDDHNLYIDNWVRTLNDPDISIDDRIGLDWEK
jgi:hypothetical protein